MSNVSTNGGLRLYKQDAAQNLEVVYFASGDGTRCGIGDAVKITSAGAASIGQGPSAVTVTRAAAGDTIDFVIESFQPQMNDGTANMDLTKMYRPASTAMYALARPALNNDVYVIQDDGNLASGVPAANGVTNVGYNANLVVTDCSTSTGLSTMQLGGASVALTATLQLKIVAVLDTITNDPTSANAKYLVTINNARRSGGTGTVGV